MKSAGTSAGASAGTSAEKSAEKSAAWNLSCPRKLNQKSNLINAASNVSFQDMFGLTA
jgi:hypothetical protein